MSNWWENWQSPREPDHWIIKVIGIPIALFMLMGCLFWPAVFFAAVVCPNVCGNAVTSFISWLLSALPG
jgi:hypothetical protein